MSAALETRELSIGYRRRRRADVLLARALNLRLERGRLVGLLGANGIGKSTLLRTLAGAQTPLAGQVLLAGAPIGRLSPEARARRLCLVLTKAPRLELMTGYALVALGRHPHTNWLGRLTAADRAAIDWALDAVKARALAAERIAELSDGQRQKLMIARALAQAGDIMLLDEPTAFLDLPRRVQMMQLLQDIARSAKRAILVSTHDLTLALRHCDQLWLMSGDGIASGAPEDLALDGRLGTTFHTEDLRFDADGGAFVLGAKGGAAVHVAGAGKQLRWMRRALERRGFHPADRPSAISIKHSGNGHGACWQLSIGGRSSRHHSIQSLLETLEAEAP